ncbi:MAG: hypothetical protein CO030_05135 [Candidatus Magasanikbacteria bacterium CG_4_9_14_0_2_um_filter_42_11]|uniref:HD/PDEase domain-containing protein n=1 Tax=Candidatus Magasanikbacteria bacterium CG_4_9_14_0_2_um_filter_42_11 TaxID=1974643 RepID=A0A2M8F8F3_9BACT|nr:MAG: hypothetical protein COU34_03060 [Candidatus Magasanikbacteria bacterium CG10_big_fil_rev_8_21_14_0_10_43_9]PIY92282.1 MAG: hypothetical protein COY70_04105 [Candidatus Magasanikbacteria bacterium CG_4_10_14_0_8_um_filter_42_12]PJC52013.1 MAG: hypothetical protein CO030_05135 [Candidatus Magasanikbacteria bacterium CG_4_9_14_0_2_um_filter_42_11]
MPLNSTQRVQSLTSQAETILMGSHDPLHDHRHAGRVADYAVVIARELHVTNASHLDALKLSAWWHDISRVITKKPSFLLMPFIDDTLSAIILARTAIKTGKWNRTVWLASRLILAKSVGTGKVFSRMFLTKRMRLLLDILQDADTVDTLASERAHDIQQLVDSSLSYHYAYRVMVWWFISTAFLEVKTEAAKEQLLAVLKEFMIWIHEESIMAWHIERYGQAWIDHMHARLEQLIEQLTQEVSFAFVRVSS